MSGNSPSIEVLIGANADRFDAVMADATKRMEQFGFSEKDLEDATVKTSKAMDNQIQSLQAQRLLLESRPEQEKAAAIKQLKDEIEKMTRVEEVATLTTKQHREAMVGLHEVVTGNFKGFAGTMMVLEETNDGVLGTLGKITAMMGGPLVVGAAAAAAAVAAVGTALYVMATHAAEDWHHMSLLAETVGTTTENIQALEFATIGTGVTSQQAAKALEIFTVKLTDHRAELQRLGITSKDPITAFEQLMDLARSIQDPIERDKVMSDALGKSWKELAPFLLQGRDAMEEAKKAMKIDPQTKKDFEEINALQIENAKAWEEIKISAGRAMSSVVLAVGEMKNGLMNNGLKDYALSLIPGYGIALAAGNAWAQGKKSMEERMQKESDDRAKAGNQTLATITASSRLKMLADEAASYAASKTALENAHMSTENLTKSHLAKLEDIRKLFDGKAKNPKKDTAGAKAEKAEANAELELDKLAWDQKVANATEGVQKIKMAEDRRFADQEAGFRKQFAGTASLQALLTSAEQLHVENLRNIDRTALENQIKDKGEQIKKLEKLNAETHLKEAEAIKKLADLEVTEANKATVARQKEVKSWIDGFASVTSSVNHGLAQMAMGHGSFRAQVNAIWSSMCENAIMETLKVAETWVAKQIMERLTAKETAVENVATKQAEAAALQVTAAAANVAAIAQAVITGGAIQAAMAPGAMSASIATFGGAAAEGGAAYEGMMAVASMTSFDVGTPRVPHDMVAQIHKNEMIVPATMADAVRKGAMTLGGSGSGGSSSHGATLALDSDIMAVVARNGHALVKVFNNHGRVAFA